MLKRSRKFSGSFQHLIRKVLRLEEKLNFIRSRNKFGMTKLPYISCCPEDFRDLFSIFLERFLNLKRTKLYKIPKSIPEDKSTLHVMLNLFQHIIKKFFRIEENITLIRSRNEFGMTKRLFTKAKLLYQIIQFV